MCVLIFDTKCFNHQTRAAVRRFREQAFILKYVIRRTNSIYKIAYRLNSSTREITHLTHTPSKPLTKLLNITLLFPNSNQMCIIFLWPLPSWNGVIWLAFVCVDDVMRKTFRSIIFCRAFELFRFDKFQCA